LVALVFSGANCGAFFVVEFGTEARGNTEGTEKTNAVILCIFSVRLTIEFFASCARLHGKSKDEEI
jgi:hypothetical protein